MYNKKVRKMMSLLLMTAMTVSLAAGCGGKKDEPKEDGKKGSGTESEADTGGYSGELVVSIHDQLNNPAVVEALDYLQTTEKWKNVSFDIMPKDQEYEVNLPIQVMGGKQIDVMYNFNPIEQDKNSSAGTIVPIGEYLDELGIDLEERYGSYASAAYNGDEAYAIPGGVTAWGLFYNKSIFDEAGVEYPDPKVPMTWSEYRELAKKLTKA